MYYCLFLSPCLNVTEASKPSISEWRRLKPKWRWISLMISAVRGSWDKSELLIPGHKLLLNMLICGWLQDLSIWGIWMESAVDYICFPYCFPLVQHDLGEHLGDTWNDAVFRSKWGVSAQMRWTGEYLWSRKLANSTARDIWDLISSWISAQWWIQQSMHVDPGSIFGKDLGGFEEFEFGIATTKTTAWDLHPAGVG